MYHVPSRPLTQPRTNTTPLHVTTFHSHLLPAHTTPSHIHLYFVYKLPVRHVPPGLVSVASKDRASLHITQPTPLTPANTQFPHALAKYTQEPWLYPPSFLTNECVCGAGTGTAQVGVLLVSCLVSLFKRSRSLMCACDTYKYDNNNYTVSMDTTLVRYHTRLT